MRPASVGRRDGPCRHEGWSSCTRCRDLQSRTSEGGTWLRPCTRQKYGASAIVRSFVASVGFGHDDIYEDTDLPGMPRRGHCRVPRGRCRIGKPAAVVRLPWSLLG
ncbi:protein of unknown function [Agreia sp. COWG]|nr:protein of unknown function [Agreia sp. COWG]